MAFDRTKQGTFGYVYYDDLLDQDNPQSWREDGEAARQYFINEADSWGDNTSNNVALLGADLLRLAEEEYQKEVQVLSKFYGLSPSTIQSDFYSKDPQATQALYANINATLQQALYAKDTAKHVLNMLDSDAASGKKKARGHETSAAHLIVDKFKQLFNNYLRSVRFKEEVLKSMTKKQAAEIITAEAYKCMERAFTTVANYTDKQLGYAAPQNKIVFENLYRLCADKSAKNAVVSSLLQGFNIKSMTASILKDINEGKSKRVPKQKKGFIGENITYGGRGQPGVVEELLNMAKSSVSNFLNEANGTVTIASQSSGGKVANTDLNWLTVKLTADLDQIEAAVREFEGPQSFGATKTDAYNRLRQFVTKVDEITGGSFALIQETTKAYVLGSKFDVGGEGFKGTSYNYTSLLDLMNRLGESNAEAMLNALLNMRAGTVLGASAKYRARAKLQFAKLFADMMFERPQINTPGGNNIIYVFRLSGTILPLSYVLRCAGLAAQTSLSNLQNMMSFTISSPPASTLIYRGVKEYGEGQINQHAQWLRWKEQMEQAHSEFVVSINFMQNFIAFLNGDLRGFMNM